MKSLTLLIALLTQVFYMSSCTITGPYTGTEYSIGANTHDGIYIKAMPLKWQSLSRTAKDLKNYLVFPPGKSDIKKCSD